MLAEDEHDFLLQYDTDEPASGDEKVVEELDVDFEDHDMEVCTQPYIQLTIDNYFVRGN